MTVRAKDQPIRTWLRIDLVPKIHTEVLNDRLRVRIHDREIQRALRNIEITLHQQRRQQHRLTVVYEAVL